MTDFDLTATPPAAGDDDKYVAVAQAAPESRRSDLDVLAEDFAAKEAEGIAESFLPVPERPPYRIGFVPDVTDDEIESWRDTARGRKGKINDHKLVSLCVANKVTSIWRGDDRLEDADGDPLNFRHRQLLDLLGVRTASEGASKFFIKEGHVDAAAKEILSASGWGEDMRSRTDPTASD